MHSCITPVLCVTWFFRNHSNMPNIWKVVLWIILFWASWNHDNIIIIASYIVQYSFPLHTSATVGHKMSASNLNKHYEESFTQNYAFGHTFLPYQGPVSLFPNRLLTFPFSHIYSGSKKEKWLDVEHDCVYWVEQKGVIEMLENHRHIYNNFTRIQANKT